MEKEKIVKRKKGKGNLKGEKAKKQWKKEK